MKNNIINKHLLLVMMSVIIGGCISFTDKQGKMTLLKCESSYVKLLKYNEQEINIFKNNKKKSIYLQSKIKDIDNCNSYPCKTCKLFMCKDPRFDVVKYQTDDNQKKQFSGIVVDDHDAYSIKRFTQENIQSLNSDYVWDIYHLNGFEYEEIYNSQNGQLVYQIITPVSTDKKNVVSECDAQVYSTFNEFYNH